VRVAIPGPTLPLFVPDGAWVPGEFGGPKSPVPCDQAPEDMAKASSEPNATMNTCFFIETLPNFAPDYKARSFDAPPQDAARVARPFDSRTAISRYDKKAPQFRGRGAFARESFFVQLGSSASRSLAPDGKRRLNEVPPISVATKVSRQPSAKDRRPASCAS
jgi:hypothetical protein